MEKFLRDYFTHMGIYGAGSSTVLWFSGHLNATTTFFEQNKIFTLFCLALHLLLFLLRNVYEAETRRRLGEAEDPKDDDDE